MTGTSYVGNKWWSLVDAAWQTMHRGGDVPTLQVPRSTFSRAPHVIWCRPCLRWCLGDKGGRGRGGCASDLCLLKFSTHPHHCALLPEYGPRNFTARPALRVTSTLCTEMVFGGGGRGAALADTHLMPC